MRFYQRFPLEFSQRLKTYIGIDKRCVAFSLCFGSTSIWAKYLFCYCVAFEQLQQYVSSSYKQKGERY